MRQVHTETMRLVRGQRLEGAPPGVAVLPPPLNPAGGREEETFVMLLDLPENTPSRLYREVREAAAQTFWSTGGSVTAALRRTVATANQALRRRGLHGALSCAALRANELFLAQAGPACACVLYKDTLEQYPQETLPSLGTEPYAETRLSYLTVRPGSTLVLASRRLDLLASGDALKRLLSQPDLGALLDGLEQVATEETLATLVVRWPEEGTTTAPSPHHRRTAPAVAAEPPPAIHYADRKKVRPPKPAVPLYASQDKAVEEGQPGRRWELAEDEEEWEEMPTWEPSAEPRPPARPSPIRRLALGDRLRRAGLGLASAAGVVGGGLRTLFRRALPGPERTGQARPRRERRPPPENPRVMAAIALVILVVVALVSVMAWVNYGSAARRRHTIATAQQYAAQAQQAADPAEERSHWQAALTALEGDESQEAAALRAQVQQALDRLDGVIRVEPTPIWESTVNLSARRLVAHGQNVFLLDTDQQAVLQMTISETGAQVTGEAAHILQAGEERGGQGVTNLIDMAWNQPGDDWATSGLVVLDTDNHLWVYDPAWADNTYFIFLGPAAGEGTPTALATFEGRLYLLDPQANQVWRYRPRDGGYPDRAEPYFATGAPQSLAQACDLAIDGNVYVLTTDGQIFKYFDREPASFTVGGVPPPTPHFAGIAVDPGLTDGPIYLIDAAAERVVVLNGKGEFQAQLRATSDAFSGLQALALDDTGSHLFLLARQKLYVLSLADLP